jgi:hypothetical protein
VLALAVDSRRRAGVVWAGTQGGVFRSADGGATWAARSPQAARELAVDPTRRRTIFAVLEGVFRSTDGGRTWRRMASVRHALSLAIDRRTKPGTVYAGTSYDGVLRSTDGGDRWEPARGGLPPLAEIVDLAIDARAPDQALHGHVGYRHIPQQRRGRDLARRRGAPATSKPSETSGREGVAPSRDAASTALLGGYREARADR